MSLYHAGLGEALRKVEGMSESKCLEVLGALYGRDNLKYGDGIDALRDEVRAQLRREYKNHDDPGWGLVDFYKEMHQVIPRADRR